MFTLFFKFVITSLFPIVYDTESIVNYKPIPDSNNNSKTEEQVHDKQNPCCTNLTKKTKLDRKQTFIVPNKKIVKK